MGQEVKGEKMRVLDWDMAGDEGWPYCNGSMERFCGAVFHDKHIQEIVDDDFKNDSYFVLSETIDPTGWAFHFRWTKELKERE